MSEKQPPTQGKGSKSRATKKYSEHFDEIFRKSIKYASKEKVMSASVAINKEYSEVFKKLGNE